MIREPYPLEWPVGHPRTPRGRRRYSRFGKWTYHSAAVELDEELRKLGGVRWVISSNLRVRQADGLPLSRQGSIDDPGVAVYVERRIREPQTGTRTIRMFAISCDVYRSVEDNIRALTLVVSAMRTIERHGSPQLMEQAMSGFKMLTAPPDVQPPWYEVLGCAEDVTLLEAESIYRRLLREKHPDRGGSDEDALRLHNAIAEAREVLQ